MSNEVGLELRQNPSNLFTERLRATVSERQQMHPLLQRRPARRCPSKESVENESRARWKRRRLSRKSSIARIITFPERRQEHREGQELEGKATTNTEDSMGIRNEGTRREEKHPGDSLEFVNEMMEEISRENMIKWSFDFTRGEKEAEEEQDS